MRPPAALVLCVAAGIAPGSAAADVVVVVSSASPVTALTKTQITEIFLGKVNRFPDGAPALAIDQSDRTAARDEFYLQYAGKSPAQVKAYWAKIIFTGRGQPPTTAADGTAVKKMLAANPQAIGYLERGDVDASLKILVQP